MESIDPFISNSPLIPAPTPPAWLWWGRTVLFSAVFDTWTLAAWSWVGRVTCQGLSFSVWKCLLLQSYRGLQLRSWGWKGLVNRETSTWTSDLIIAPFRTTSVFLPGKRNNPAGMLEIETLPRLCFWAFAWHEPRPPAEGNHGIYNCPSPEIITLECQHSGGQALVPFLKWWIIHSPTELAVSRSHTNSKLLTIKNKKAWDWFKGWVFVLVWAWSWSCPGVRRVLCEGTGLEIPPPHPLVRILRSCPVSGGGVLLIQGHRMWPGFAACTGQTSGSRNPQLDHSFHGCHCIPRA